MKIEIKISPLGNQHGVYYYIDFGFIFYEFKDCNEYRLGSYTSKTTCTFKFQNIGRKEIKLILNYYKAEEMLRKGAVR